MVREGFLGGVRVVSRTKRQLRLDDIGRLDAMLSMKALISCELIGTFIFLTYFGTVIRGNKIHHSLPVSYRNQLFILGLEGEKEHLCVVVFVEREPHQRLGEGARSRKVDFVVSRPRFGCLGLPGGA